jgi:outer membrane immunogenic protein
MTSHRKIAVTAALMCAVGASPALAQDSYEDTFRGPYVSVYGGLTAVGDGPTDVILFDTDRDGSFDDQVNTATGANAFAPGFCSGGALGPTRPCTSDPQQEEFGIRAGIDGRPGDSMFLAGVLVEVGKTNLTNGTAAFSTTPAHYTITRRMDYAVSARGRLGVVAGNSALFYATGGVSYAKMDQLFTTSNTTNSFTEVNDDKMRFGIQAGGGVEVALTPKVRVGLEYLRSEYDDDSYYVQVGPGTAGPTNPFLLVDPTGTDMKPSNEKFGTHSLRVSASMQF